MSARPRVAVALSGGVDSSVAAALLVEQGYDVIGLMLRLWSESGPERQNRCCTPEAIALARRVAAQLGIPFYLLDARQVFRARVVDFFVREYVRGATPNPCLECNRQVRWGYLRDHARALGAECLATGHYARRQEDESQVRLLRGRDTDKDQSYVLSVLDQEHLRQTLFPLGELTKTEVRAHARRLGLPVADRPESQDLCFLAGRDYRPFVAREAPEAFRPGPIVSAEGKPLGTHVGLPGYTVGQRKGIRVASRRPLYVIGVHPERNELVVGHADELGWRGLTTGRAHWINTPAPRGDTRLEVKIRYRAPAVAAAVIPRGDGTCGVEFEVPVRDITPGQAAVFYAGDWCLGSALIVAPEGKTADCSKGDAGPEGQAARQDCMQAEECER